VRRCGGGVGWRIIGFARSVQRGHERPRVLEGVLDQRGHRLGTHRFGVLPCSGELRVRLAVGGAVLVRVVVEPAGGL